MSVGQRVSRSLIVFALFMAAEVHASERIGGGADVLYEYPKDAEALSVDPSGAATLGLKVPVFPGYLQPQLVLTYNSRGGDGPLGMGWQLAAPNIVLDLRDSTDAIGSSADEYIESFTIDGATEYYLSGRWIASPGGELVCEGPSPFTSNACFTNPRGVIRYQPEDLDSDGYEDMFVVDDPYEGVSQTYGGSEATLIRSSAGQAVSFLLNKETNLYGEEIQHFYEEKTGSDDRLRVAISMGGDKVIQFVYAARTTNITTNFRLTVPRTTEYNLREIVLWRGCQVSQQALGDDITTDFSDCEANGTKEEKVVLTVDAGASYTGHYLLTSFKHTSGDGLVAYKEVTFNYNGAGFPATGDGVSTSNVVTEETASFDLPDGFVLPTASLYAPFASYMDFNRDGLPDLITTKQSNESYVPNIGGPHEIFVHPRNGTGSFDAPRTYEEPLARYAAWLWFDGASEASELWVAENTDDNRYTLWDALGAANTAHLEGHVGPGSGGFAGGLWTEANIGINGYAWMYDELDDEDPADDGYVSVPIFESLSMTVPCEKLPGTLCDELKGNYCTLYPENCDCPENYTEPSECFYEDLALAVKVSDLIDMDGDGYLDRVASGLLVNYDPAAPDAGANGIRNPVTGTPCVYVSFFDPPSDDFQPFVRYQIKPPTDYPDLSTAFLSALAVEVNYNQKPGNGDMSNQSAVSSELAVLGFADNAMGVVANPNASWKDGAVFMGGALLSSVSQIAHGLGASPEVTAALSQVSLGTGLVTSGMSIAAKVEHAVASGGWLNPINAVVGVAGGLAEMGIASTAARRMTAPGYNAAVVAANAQTAMALVGKVTTGISVVALGLLALFGPPAFGAVIAAVFALVSLIIQLLSSSAVSGYLTYDEGTVPWEVKSERGLVWTENKNIESNSFLLSTWMDITGDGRADLVVARGDAINDSFVVARSNVEELPAAWATELWTEWEFGSSPPSSVSVLGSSRTTTHFEGLDVHRGDLTSVEVGFLDMNGDGLPDLVDTSDISGSAYGPVVYLNNGMGFAAGASWDASLANASAPDSCANRPRLSRTRGISWSEFVSETDTRNVSVSNSIQMLGPDINMDGLPDIVIKDELHYDHFASGATCARSGTLGPNVCDERMPADAEPEPTGEDDCDGTPTDECALNESNGLVWFGDFDDGSANSGQGEGACHFTSVAQDVNSPKTLANHYVSFNTGSGFTNFIVIDTPMPSFGGGISVTNTTNSAKAVPNYAFSGTSNFFVDADGRGQLDLIAYDIEDDAIDDPQGTNPVAGRYRFGFANPDALMNIHYPEGGDVFFTYAPHLEIQGQQGPGLWVLDRVTFADKIGSPATVEYKYTGGKLEGRDWLGFQAIAETRRSATDYTQVIQVSSQDQATLGAVTCLEVRGKTRDRDCASESDGDGFPGDDTANVASCFADAETELGPLQPLQKRLDYEYDSHTIFETLGDGVTTDAVWVDYDMETLASSIYNGSASNATTTITVSYDAAPYKTPSSATLANTSGVLRTLATSWVHKDSDWYFYKDLETKLNADGTTFVATVFEHNPASPYDLTRVSEDSGTAARTKSYVNDPNTGMPTSITEAGVTTEYTWYQNSECGTGLVKSIRRWADAYAPEGTKQYEYDCMGRLIAMTDETGRVNTWEYDALGVLTADTPAGLHRRTYVHDNVGAPGLGTASAALLASQSITQSTRVVGASRSEDVMNITFLDGFGRTHRLGQKIEGHYDVAMDLDADGVTENTVLFEDDANWFAAQGNKSYLLRDFKLTGQGDIWCTSLPYPDGITPMVWDGVLYDSERRPTRHTDYTGFSTKTLYEVDSHRVRTVSSDALGAWTTREYDALERVTYEDRSGLESDSLVYNDWDGMTRRTDKLGNIEIHELNGWNQPTKVCRQDNSFVPFSDVCPAGWQGERYAYDSYGQVTQVTDARGNMTTTTQSACRAPGLITYPSTSSTDVTKTSALRFAYDAACRVTSKRERNLSDTVYAYDSGGRLTRTTLAAGLPESSALHSSYDSLGRLLYTEDGRGYRTYSIFDFRGLPLYSYGAEGVVTLATYDPLGCMATATDAEGLTVTQASDYMCRVINRSWPAEVCDIASFTTPTLTNSTVTSSETFGLDVKGRMTAHTDAAGSKRTFEYDALDRTTKAYATDLAAAHQVDPTVFMTWAYDGAGNLTEVRDFAGHTSTYAYDSLKRRTQELVPTSSTHDLTTVMKYDDNGNLTRVESPNRASGSACALSSGASDSFVTEYTYSPMNQLERTTYPEDETSTRNSDENSYDRAGNLITVLDALDDTTSYAYDAQRRVTQKTAADLTAQTFGYDRSGNLTSYVDERALATQMSYDGLGRRTEVVPPTGYPTVTAYDKRGQPSFTATLINSSNLWEAVKHRYTTDGALYEEAAATYTGTSPTYAALTALTTDRACYEYRGLPMATQDGRGNVRQARYDSRGRRTGLLIPSGGGVWETISSAYDDDDLVVSETAPMGGSGPATVATTLGYDWAHRRTGEAYTQAHDTKAITYDDNGNVCQVADVSGGTTDRSVAMTYDARGLTLSRQGTPGTLETTSWDAAGRLTQASDETGSWMFYYDEVNRLTLQDQHVDRLGATFMTGFAYTDSGLLESVTYPDVLGFPQGPTVLVMEYEATTNRVARVSTDVSIVAENLSYDGKERVLEYDQGIHGAEQSYAFNARGLLASHRIIKNAVSELDLTYAYDDTDNITRIDDLVQGSFTSDYYYDARNRLIRSNSVANGDWSYSLNSQDLIERAYDTFNPFSINSRTFTYDARGNLSRVTQGIANYTYTSDAYANRAGRTSTSSSQGFVWDALNRMDSVTIDGNTTNADYGFDTRRVIMGNRVYLYGDGRLPLVEITLDGSGNPVDVYYNVYFQGGLAEQVNGYTGGTRYYGRDHLGSPVLEWGGPTPFMHRAYLPFGEETPYYVGEDLATDLSFQGNYQDDTGLQLMHYRYYDPFTASFVSPDPQGLSAGSSRFAFANANPQNFVDPWGLEGEAIDGYPGTWALGGDGVYVPADDVAMNWKSAQLNQGVLMVIGDRNASDGIAEREAIEAVSILGSLPVALRSRLAEQAMNWYLDNTLGGWALVGAAGAYDSSVPQPVKPVVRAVGVAAEDVYPVRALGTAAVRAASKVIAVRQALSSVGQIMQDIPLGGGTSIRGGLVIDGTTIDPVTEEVMQSFGLTPETPLYRSMKPTRLNPNGTVSGNPYSTALVQDPYSPKVSHPLGVAGLPRVARSVEASQVGAGLNVAKEPTVEYLDRGNVMISVRLGDALKQGGRIYPDVGCPYVLIGPLYVTFEGSIPFKIGILGDALKIVDGKIVKVR